MLFRYIHRYIVVIALGLTTSVYSQDYHTLDSLLTEISVSQHDTTSIRLYKELCYKSIFSAPDTVSYYAEILMDLAKENADTNAIAKAHNYFGVIAILQSQNISALESFKEALSYYESIGDAEGATRVLNNIGIIHTELGDYDEAIRIYKEGYDLNIKLGEFESAEINIYNIANNYVSLEQFDLAEQYTEELIALQKEHNIYNVSSELLTGNIQLEHYERADSAKYYYNLAYQRELSIGNSQFIAYSLLSLAEAEFTLGNNQEALSRLEEVEAIASQNEFTSITLESFELKAKIYHDDNLNDLAYQCHVDFVTLKDSLDEINNFNQISELATKYQTEKREKELSEKNAQIAQQETSERLKLRIFLIVVVFIVLILAIVTYNLIKKKKLNKVLNSQNLEITQQRTKIISSINYAKKIQNSILVPEDKLKQFLPESFVYFRPKDIVSGDFYWFSRFDNKLMIATIDCTGHGVPGAFMSLIANSKLNKVVNEMKVRDPGEILYQVHNEIISSLQQKEKKDNAQDGMDMSLCVIDPDNNTIEFAGAQNSIFLIKDGIAQEVKADNISIGGTFFMNHLEDHEKFKTHVLAYEADTFLYMFTDGYFDQFGGNKNKKMNKKRFLDILLESSKAGLSNAKEMFDQSFEQWKGNNQQLDDVLIIGTKL